MKLFLDANVIYAAAKSGAGASAAVFQLKRKLKLQLVSSRLALVEAERNISSKEDFIILERLYQLIKEITIITVDSDKAKYYYEKIIEEKDAPILFGAKKCRANFLVTLDKKHFFTKKLKNKKLGFKIITPGEFIKDLMV